MLAIDANGMALLSALAEALPHPVYVQEIDSGASCMATRGSASCSDIRAAADRQRRIPRRARTAGTCCTRIRCAGSTGRRGALRADRRDRGAPRARADRQAPRRRAPHRAADRARRVRLGGGARAQPAAGGDRDLQPQLHAHAAGGQPGLRRAAAGHAHLPRPGEARRPHHPAPARPAAPARAGVRRAGPERAGGAVLRLAEPGAREAGIRFERRLSAQPPLVRADRLLIEQVALNLVRNAVEAVQDRCRRSAGASRSRRASRSTAAARSRSRTSARACPSEARSACSPPSSPPSRAAWAWASRSAARWSRRTAARSGMRERKRGRGALFAFTLPRAAAGPGGLHRRRRLRGAQCLAPAVPHAAASRSKRFPSADAFLEDADLTRRCCVLLDIRMPGMTGTALHDELLRPRHPRAGHLHHRPRRHPHGQVEAMKKGALTSSRSPSTTSSCCRRCGRSAGLQAGIRRVGHAGAAAAQRCQRSVLDRVLEGGPIARSPRSSRSALKTVEFHRARIMLRE